MPYVIPEQRQVISIHNAQRKRATRPGELNFLFTEVVVSYLNSQGLCYQTINDIVGALEQAKDEFRRRVVHPYEDEKIVSAGDVYPSQFTKKGEESS